MDEGESIPEAAEVKIIGRLTDLDVTTHTEVLPFGTYWVDTCTQTENLYSLTCYDAMLKTSQAMVEEGDSKADWSKSMTEVVQLIATRIGVSIDPRTRLKTGASYMVPYPEDYTMQQVLGWIGACNGGNWTITDEGMLRLVPLTAPPAETYHIVDHEYNDVVTSKGDQLAWAISTEKPATVPISGTPVESPVKKMYPIVDHEFNQIVTSDGFLLVYDESGSVRAEQGLLHIPFVCGDITKGKRLKVSGILMTDADGNTFAKGSDDGFVIEVDGCPYACQTICDDLYKMLKDIEYEPFTAPDAVFDPAAELGDQVKIGDRIRSVIYSMDMSLDIGYSNSISAPTSTETTRQYPYLKGREKKVEDALKNAERAQSTADGKSRTFTTVPVPPYNIGDFWTCGADYTWTSGSTTMTFESGEIYRAAADRTEGSFVGSDWVKASKYTDDSYAEKLEKETIEKINGLQTQVDGKVEMWYYNGVPSPSNSPAKDWTDANTKKVHLGDLYYDLNTGKSYRWSQNGSEYRWEQVRDADIVKALDDAKNAQATADHKIASFTSQPYPPYEKGDLWTAGSNGDIKVCIKSRVKGESYNAGDWTLASKYTDDTAANAAQRSADNAQKSADAAQSSANKAQTSADNAQKSADAAQSSANKAQTSADNAQKSADAAQTAASKAQTSATSAGTAASEAKTTASAAKTAASEAKTTAGEAKTAAGQANDAASSAKTAAGEAKTAASEAKTAAAEAKSTANTAKSTANTANSTANTANSTANAAKTAAAEAGKTATNFLSYSDTEGLIIRHTSIPGKKVQVTNSGVTVTDGTSSVSITSGGISITDGTGSCSISSGAITFHGIKNNIELFRNDATSYAAQEYSVNLSTYSAVLIVFRSNKGGTWFASGGDSGLISMVAPVNGVELSMVYPWNTVHRRSIKVCSDKIVFGAGYERTSGYSPGGVVLGFGPLISSFDLETPSSDGWKQDNTKCVPYRIYGFM